MRCSGPITTLKVSEDDMLIKRAVESLGEFLVVVDGGRSQCCGLVGGSLAVTAAADGIVVLPEASAEASSLSWRSAASQQTGEAVGAAGLPLGGRHALGRLREGGVPFVQPGPHVVRRVGAALALVAGQDRTGRGDPGEAGQSEQLPRAHAP